MAKYAETKEEMLLMALVDHEEINTEHTWYLDSGCSNHMCGDKTLFSELDNSFTESVKLGNNSKLGVQGKGRIRFEVRGIVFLIPEVFYVPDLKNNLLSLGQLQEKGMTVLIKHGKCKIFHASKGLIIESKITQNRMFCVHARCTSEGQKRLGAYMTSSQKCLQSATIDQSKLWHCRYGHLSWNGLQLLQQKGMVKGLPKFVCSQTVCEDCLKGRQHRDPFPTECSWRASKILQLIHSDICGPINPCSNSKKRYLLTFIDDFSRKVWIYFLAEKSEAFEIFKCYKARVEKESGAYICSVRTDRGGEFTSQEFTHFCEIHGIHRQLTAAYTPQQNGVAERKNRTIMNMVRSMLFAKSIPSNFWAEAANWCVHVLNRCPTLAVKNRTPEEAWSGLKPSVDHFRIFGCISHVHVPDSRRVKLDAKSFKCILLGVSEESKAYRLFNPATNKIIVSRDVVFEEDQQWCWDNSSNTDLGTALEWDTHEATVTGDEELAAAQPVHAEGHADGEIAVDDNVAIADSGDIEFEIDAEEEIGVAIDAAPRQSAQMQRLDFSNDTGSSSRTGAVLGEIVDGQGLDFSKAGEMDLCALQNDDEQHISGSVNLEKQGRIRKPPAWLQDYSTGQEFSDEEPGNTMFLAMLGDSDPMTYEEAVKSEKWRSAMDQEMQAIERNDTWELTELPIGGKSIGVKWIFKTKVNESGEVDKYKARLVAKGYCQQYGIDYAEVFAPVARMDTIRIVIALAAQNNWVIYQLDVKSAFLHGEINEEVFVNQPPGYEQKGHESKVYRLKKALYGLKQAPRAWYSRIETYFMEEGFTKCPYEHTLFIKTAGGGKILIVCLYVDDLIFTGNDHMLFAQFKNSMMTTFDMTDLGRMRFFLGIEVLQRTDGIFISQRKYAQEILERFKMDQCNSVHNPAVPGFKLTKDEGGVKVDSTLYKQIVGSLMYLTATRPDLMFIVSLISRYMESPTESHLLAAKRILRYIKGTTNFGIFYKKGGNTEFFGYTDSDYAGDQDDRRSTSGYVFFMGSGAISWSSKKQPVVSLSTTEAEFIAAASSACQVVWINRILKSLNQTQHTPTKVYCDNISAIKLSKNPVMHGRNKHIDIRFHFLRELVKDGSVELITCSTTEQVADILIKPLKLDVFLKMRKLLGVCESPSIN
jgi:transposase InsO family protein